jgi:hypothetical protein
MNYKTSVKEPEAIPTVAKNTVVAFPMRLLQGTSIAEVHVR